MVLSGGNSGYFPAHNDTVKEFEWELSRLIRSDNVYQVEPDKVDEQLSTIGRSLLMRASTNGAFYTSWYDSGDGTMSLSTATL